MVDNVGHGVVKNGILNEYSAQIPLIPVYNPPSIVGRQRHTMLDLQVRDMVSRCTCPSQFPMIQVSDGKYRVGDSQTLIFVRVSRPRMT